MASTFWKGWVILIAMRLLLLIKEGGEVVWGDFWKKFLPNKMGEKSILIFKISVCWLYLATMTAPRLRFLIGRITLRYKMAKTTEFLSESLATTIKNTSRKASCETAAELNLFHSRRNSMSNSGGSNKPSSRSSTYEVLRKPNNEIHDLNYKIDMVESKSSSSASSRRSSFMSSPRKSDNATTAESNVVLERRDSLSKSHSGGSNSFRDSRRSSIIAQDNSPNWKPNQEVIEMNNLDRRNSLSKSHSGGSNKPSRRPSIYKARRKASVSGETPGYGSLSRTRADSSENKSSHSFVAYDYTRDASNSDNYSKESLGHEEFESAWKPDLILSGNSSPVGSFTNVYMPTRPPAGRRNSRMNEVVTNPSNSAMPTLGEERLLCEDKQKGKTRQKRFSQT